MDAIKTNFPLEINQEFRPTKNSIEMAALEFIQTATDGRTRVEDIAIAVETLKKIVAQVEKDFKQSISRHLYTKYARGEQITVRGCTIERMETGVQFDYSICGDEYYNSLIEEMETLSEKIKSRQELLKSIPDGKTITVVNELTGEIMQLRKPLRTSTDSYKIKFPTK